MNYDVIQHALMNIVGTQKPLRREALGLVEVTGGQEDGI